MTAALALAERSLFITSPNPHVGCVITDDQGRVLGEGSTQAAGSAHAEVMALRDAQARGHSVRGATAWVTLEPCAHHGRTGPCCEALGQAGVGRVVASVLDPNPKVAGQGLEFLRRAGVQVETGPGALASRELNIGFFSRMVRGTPWVRLKVAASLDGATALDNGRSLWITSAAARADGHAWRARACAILTGIGTVLEDDPRLDVREVPTPRQPALVVVDSRLQLPLTARLLGPGPRVANRRVLVYTARPDPAHAAALQARGVEVIPLPDARGKVDLSAMLRDLGQREINELHVEAGHKLNGSLLREGLVDECLVYLAPLLLGTGIGMTALGPLTELSQGVRLDFVDTRPVGPDLRLLARLPGRDRF